jgi:hypothetical protein
MKSTRMESTQQTDIFTITLGINPGYFHDNDLKPEQAITEMIKKWREIAYHVEQQAGFFVSAQIHQGKAIYEIERGCPQEGEDIFIIQGIRNPHKITDAEQWRKAVITICQKLKTHFNQKTAYLTFDITSFVYVTD